MPLFTYECENCEIVKEFLVKSSDSTDPVCECGKTMVKMIGRSNFVLKGSGWYRDGYSSKPDHLKESDNSDDMKGLVRIPNYADRNTGKSLGQGSPEILLDH